jgi:pimeloyl-ACP methyl ester carboxylesterase
MPTVQLPGGETMWYKKTGTGAPLLHIHGSAFGHRNFEKMTPLMSPHFEVIDIDLPGYGESKGTPRPGGMAGIADQVFETIVALKYPKVHIHGTSFGAMIALTMTARHPEVVDKLVLSCFLCRYDQAAREMRGTWKRAARESGMTAVADLTSVAGFARSFYERPGAQAQLQAMRDAFSKNTPEAMIAGTESIEKADLTPYIPQIKVPVFLIGGDEDNMTPYKPAASGVGFAQIKEMRPEWEMVMLSECGHYLVIEQPEKAAELITAFIKR